MFERRDTQYPKTWKEMSYDFRLFFVFLGCVMFLTLVQAVSSRSLPTSAMIAAVGSLVLILAGLSIRHRMKTEWHWPGVKFRNVLGGIFVVVFGGFFLVAATRRTSLFDPGIFPWVVCVGSIILFGILSNLNLVFLTESEFQRQCGHPQTEEPGPRASLEPTWKRTARVAFRVYFLIAWVVAVGYIWKADTARFDGSPEKTATYTTPFTDHGNTVYVRPEDKRILVLLRVAAFFGVFSAALLALLLHHGAGVRILPHRRTRLDTLGPINRR